MLKLQPEVRPNGSSLCGYFPDQALITGAKQEATMISNGAWQGRPGEPAG